MFDSRVTGELLGRTNSQKRKASGIGRIATSMFVCDTIMDKAYCANFWSIKQHIFMLTLVVVAFHDIAAAAVKGNKLDVVKRRGHAPTQSQIISPMAPDLNPDWTDCSISGRQEVMSPEILGVASTNNNHMITLMIPVVGHCAGTHIKWNSMECSTK